MRGLHPGVLKFLEDATGFDAEMLAYFTWIRGVVANQEHMIARAEAIEKGPQF
jgi:hypothetical protein